MMDFAILAEELMGAVVCKEDRKVQSKTNLIVISVAGLWTEIS
jgi:hypothetical protein